MLEVSEYDTVNIVFPFIGALVDECCGLLRTAKTLKVFIYYVDMGNLLYRNDLIPGRTEEGLQQLHEISNCSKN